MFSIPEQFLVVEKFVDLNMNAAKAAMAESTGAAKELLSVKEPQEFFSLSTAGTTAY